MPKPLVLVQLSDLHFHAEVRPAFWDPIPGYRGHDFELTRALPLALRDLTFDLGLDEAAELRFLVTGDVSVAGTREEFATAMAYLRNRRILDPREGLPWGLGLANPEPFRVPGNHDHWDGRMLRPVPGYTLQRAYNPGIFPDPFAVHPWGPVELEGDGFVLELAGLDSLSGFSSGSTNLLARGALSPHHVLQLRTRLRASRSAWMDGERRLRCLLLHHPVWPKLRPDMRLDLPSRRLLCDLAREHDVHVVLVGHEHHFDVREPSTGLLDGLRRVFWEVRAPSAFQGAARDQVQGFLVHVLRADTRSAPSVRWTVHPYYWSVLDHRFVHDPADDQAFDCRL